jgi:Flp pilus assembly protein TadD
MTLRPDHFLARYGLGRALLEKGDLDSAIQYCRAALLIRPGDPDCYTTLGIALEEKGEPAEAVQQYEKALENSPRSISALTNLAWLLATCPNESLRNGSKAVELAMQADQLAQGANTRVLRTLAAAYAEKGEFGKAIRTAVAARQLARMHGEESLATNLDQQIALYRLDMPYHETPK